VNKVENGKMGHTKKIFKKTDHMAVRGQIFEGMGAGVSGWSPLLG
jgi:hypothetical protein